MTTSQLKKVEVVYDAYIAILVTTMRRMKQLIIDTGDFEWPDYPDEYVEYKIRVMFDFRVLCIFRDLVHAHPVSDTPEYHKLRRQQDVAEEKYQRLARKYAPIEQIRPLQPHVRGFVQELIDNLGS